MPDVSTARRLPQIAHRQEGSEGGQRTRPGWRPAWSQVAGLRALRAVLVVPPLFALTFEGFGNLQMALFAAHLQHLGSHARAIAAPASHVAEQRRVPWWR
jgi:hypothetical protein